LSLVLDSSVALAWVYDDEGSAATDRVLDLVVQSEAWVPAIWRLEVANSLEQAVRRGRIDALFRDAALADLSNLDIRIDTETNAYAWTTTLALAERFGLTLYDAAYLELARRRNLPLASLDRDLRVAAGSVEVILLGV
jgi:predicted nucleic acid-binding protein